MVFIIRLLIKTFYIFNFLYFYLFLFEIKSIIQNKQNLPFKDKFLNWITDW